MSEEEKMQKLLDVKSQELGEFFDHVLIFCCKDEGEDEFMYIGQNGSRRAMYSMAKEFLMHEEDSMRYGTEASEEDED